MEELNEKIAKWCGFKFSHKNKAKNFFTGAPGRFVKFWFYLNGEVSELPDFPNDIKACFEYIVPKLTSFRITYNPLYIDGYFAEIKETKNYLATEETPALAFCRAVEKLIDEDTR